MSQQKKVQETCPRCAIGDYGRAPRSDGLKHAVTTETPSVKQLEEWDFDGICEATDGCRVEPDGRCPHGHTSWLRVVGIV